MRQDDLRLLVVWFSVDVIDRPSFDCSDPPIYEFARNWTTTARCGASNLRADCSFTRYMLGLAVASVVRAPASRTFVMHQSDSTEPDVSFCWISTESRRLFLIRRVVTYLPGHPTTLFDARPPQDLIFCRCLGQCHGTVGAIFSELLT